MQGLRSAWREAKNIANGYSDIQAKMREATSVDHNGPSTAQLQELAAATHHSSFMSDLIYIFNKRLNDHGKYWRHVYKTLVVLEYCVVFGSEAIVHFAKESIYTIKTLKEFIHIDEKGRDKGILVREKSKDLVELLSDEGLLAQCRLSGQLPKYTRPKSAEPIIVDPNQRKRLGREDNNYSDLQNMDENEAMRMALTASRTDNSRYKSLELDAESDSSGEEDKYHQNPFAVPAIDYMANPFANNNFEYASIEANPFSNSLAITYENNLAMTPQQFQIENPFQNVIPQIEYNIPSTIQEPVINKFQPISEETPFIPRPDAFKFSASENTIAAKPVGPHTTAPQFTYSKSLGRKPEEDPFGEDLLSPFTSEAHNSPHFNLQK